MMTISKVSSGVYRLWALSAFFFLGLGFFWVFGCVFFLRFGVSLCY